MIFGFEGGIRNPFFVDLEDIEIDKSLVDTGIIDSMGLIEIATYIQKQYGLIICFRLPSHFSMVLIIKSISTPGL